MYQTVHKDEAGSVGYALAKNSLQERNRRTGAKSGNI